MGVSCRRAAPSSPTSWKQKATRASAPRTEGAMAATPETEVVAEIGSDYKYGFHDEENYFFKSGRGLSPELVANISEHKNEPEWMRKFRLKSLEYFRARPLPNWGGDLSG